MKSFRKLLLTIFACFLAGGLAAAPPCLGLAKPIPLSEIPSGVSAWDWQSFIHRHTLDGYSSVAAEVDANTVPAFNAFDSVEGTAMHPVGVCCDGCSVVVILLKQKTAAPGNIRFTITGPSGGFPATGSLSATFPNIPAPQSATAGEVATVVVPSSAYTVAFYRPPASYLGASSGSAMPSSNGWPSVDITVTSSTGVVLGAAQLTLRPPPVLLVHGLDSGPGTWDYPPPAGALPDQGAYPFFGSLNPQKNAVLAADYSSENTSGLATVMPTVLDSLRGLVADSRDGSVEDTQADAVCHSYGGLICKCLAENAQNLIVQRPAGFPQFDWSAQLDGEYLRYDNDNLGYFDRVVTLGSPLDGSPIASVLMGALASDYGAVGYAHMLQILQVARLGGNGDAISDLATQNAVIQAMAARPAVQWRPIAITMAPQTQQQLDNDLAGGYWIAADFAKYFIGLNWAKLGLTPTASDGVVSLESQTDSGYANDVNPKVGVGNLFHTGEPGNQGVWVDAADLLEWDNTGAVSGSYTMFKPSF